MKRFVILAIAVVLTAFLLMSPASVPKNDVPHAPRMAMDAAGTAVAGGFQVSPGDQGVFALFQSRTNGDDLRSLGRFHGRLVGVALNDAGGVLALTRDGALGRYDDDVDLIAQPDSRWRMVGLTWYDGAPLAFTVDEEQLYAVRPDGREGWIQAETPIVSAGSVVRMDAVIIGDMLHIVWNSHAEDLSRGALRHMTFDGARWNEEAPLAIGDVASFAALEVTPDHQPLFASGENGEEHSNQALGVVALRRDVLTGAVKAASAYSWQAGKWSRLSMPDGLGDTLQRHRAFAAVSAGESPAAWLTTGESGAFFTPSGSAPADVTIRVGGEASEQPVTSRMGALFTIAAMLLLVVMYCRRSRLLSRTFPARVPDLFSRGAALMLDWFLVSFAMGAYHVANGDILIMPELMTLGDLQSIFWANLAALIVFTAIAEAMFGRTPGKYLAGLRVRSVTGGRPGFLQAILRNLMRVADMFPLPVAFPGLVGLIVTLFGPRRQRIGDIMAGTIVRRHWPLSKRRFLLASASPRRLELIQALGLDVRAEAMDIDEDAIKEPTPEETVSRLSREKARAASAKASTVGEIVVAADTVVVLDGGIMGKPDSAADAASMLRQLSGRSHQVLTGVTVWDSLTGQGLTRVEETEVEFRQLSEQEILTYVASGDPMDKAGAYGVQSGLLVKQVRGSLSNVAGLPMEKLQGMLLTLDS